MKCVLGLLIFILFSIPAWAAPTGPCARKLLAPSERQGTTTQFIMYLEILFQQRIISLGDLAELSQSLQKNKITNPILNKDKNKQHAFSYKSFQELINLGNLDLAQIQEWVRLTAEKNQFVLEQKGITQTQTKSLPAFISHDGFMFFLFRHPVLGEVYRILKPNGRVENESDWEKYVWAKYPLKDEKKENLKVGEGEKFLGSSGSRMACKGLGMGVDLPSYDDYKQLLSHFETVVNSNDVHLSTEGEKKFHKLFPDSGEAWFWSRTTLRNRSTGVWVFNGIASSLIFNERDGFARALRCISTWKKEWNK